MPSSRDLERQLSLAQLKLAKASQAEDFTFIFVGLSGEKYSEADYSRAEASAVAQARGQGYKCGVLYAELERPKPGSLPVRKRSRKAMAEQARSNP